MLRIVVDTNVVVSSYYSKTGPPARILEAVAERALTLLVTVEIVAEYEEVLNRPWSLGRHGLTEMALHASLATTLRMSELVVLSEKIAAVAADPDDDIFIECAVAGGADFIISGDKHLLGMGSYEGISIVNAANFVAYLDRFPEEL